MLAPLVAAAPDDLELRLALGNALDLMGQIALDMGDARASERFLRDDLATLEAAPEGERQRPELRRSVSTAWGHLGDALDDRGDLAGALASHRRSRTIRQALASEFPDNADYARIVSSARYYEALVLSEMGRWAEALPLFRANVRDDPAGFSVLRMGDALEALGRPAEALAQHRRVFRQHDAELQADSANLYKKLAVAEDRSKVCLMLARLREPAAAATCAQTEAFVAATPIEASNAFPRAIFARAWFRLGSAHELMATGHSSSASATHRLAARDMYRRSDEIWRDLGSRGLLSRNDAAQPDSVARALARVGGSAH
ncbi:MAG TPA: hypothetical protein VLN49_18275 [Gemmatimonadaceae bacterium]|nr:hypothetical protein [Gemmatimonadaceae bacterium]